MKKLTIFVPLALVALVAYSSVSSGRGIPPAARSLVVASSAAPELLQNGHDQPFAFREWSGSLVTLEVCPQPHAKAVLFDWNAAKGLGDPQEWSADIAVEATSFFPTNARWISDGSLIIAGASISSGELIVEQWSLGEKGQPPSVSTSTDSAGALVTKWTRPGVVSRKLILDGKGTGLGAPESIQEVVAPQGAAMLIRMRNTGDVARVAIDGSGVTWSIAASPVAQANSILLPDFSTKDLFSTSAHVYSGGGYFYVFSDSAARLHNLAVEDITGYRLIDSDSDGLVDAYEEGSGYAVLDWLHEPGAW